MAAQVTKRFNLQKECHKDETTDFGHNRIETRTCEATSNLTFLDDKKLWSDLKSVVKVPPIDTTSKQESQFMKSVTTLPLWIPIPSK